MIKITRDNDYNSPIYDRYVNEISLNPFDRSTLISFFEMDFEKMHIKINTNDIHKVVDILNGIPSYLVKFGNRRVQFQDIDKAIKSIFKAWPEQ